jgi:hypothetical protein
MSVNDLINNCCIGLLQLVSLECRLGQQSELIQTKECSLVVVQLVLLL